MSSKPSSKSSPMPSSHQARAKSSEIASSDSSAISFSLSSRARSSNERRKVASSNAPPDDARRLAIAFFMLTFYLVADTVIALPENTNHLTNNGTYMHHIFNAGRI